MKTSVVPLDHLPRVLAACDTRGLIKLVADRQTDKLPGREITAPEGSDTIQTLAMALKFGMTTRALGETVFPYLTTVEGLKPAAQTFDMDLRKLSCCAGWNAIRLNDKTWWGCLRATPMCWTRPALLLLPNILAEGTMSARRA